MVTNHVYTVAGAKGGVGKTTSSINLGTLLATAGYSTVVVEMDLPMANLVDFLDVDIDTDEDATLHDVLAGDASVTDAMYETDTNLTIVPSGTTLDGYVDTDLDRLPDIVETLRWHHDVVLLDTPAGVSEETIRPLQLADEVLLVSTPRVASIRNVSNTKELAERVDAPVRGLILTKSGTGASPGADEISEFLNVELLGHVPEDDAVPHSQDGGVPVVQNAPSSGAAIAYKRISKQLVEAEKASTESTADTPTQSDSPIPDDTVSASRRTDHQTQPHTAESVGTTDGGRKIHHSDGSADDSDLIGPSPASQEAGADRPADDTAESAGSARTPVSERQPPGSEENAEAPSIIDGTDLVDTDSGLGDGAAENAHMPDAAAGTSQSAGNDLGQDTGASQHETEPATGSPSDSTRESDSEATNDGDDADGLGARMRALFGL
ncbi:septum site-determining protein MinD [Haloarcula sp. CBA1130]|uniref:P-loop NTPase n=1 Tax=unclassified Haloarcula TaxID=2624677 RepID=UPI00124553A6|nr:MULTISPECIES: P-loop NTPase [unclassified Haloarcula]KAA9396800.1 septum site-determining protein MinD [Haloarcula sp. CBA1129]KAA9401761.1 septum site-determining protein MinD [Haloarcula sp. CBA1130]